MISVRRLFIVLFVLIQILFIACNQPNKDKEFNKKAVNKETLIRANKAVVKTEDQQIEDYILRHHWKMKTTATGLRYLIYRQGKGQPVQANQTVVFEYSIHLLDGSLCYNSDESGAKTVVLGRGQIERGLEEGILLLKKGDRAKFIIPSHLAFGLVGDGSKIPAKATLVYDIEITELK